MTWASIIMFVFYSYWLVLVDAPAGLFENVDCSVKVVPRQKFLLLVDGFLRKAADKWIGSLITWL